VKRILISGAGGDVGAGAISVIRRHFPDTIIIGVDVHRENAAPYMCDQFELVPRADSPDYLARISHIYARVEPDAFIPTSDAEVELLAQFHTPELPNLLVPSAKAVTVGKDKLATFQFLQEIGIKAPWTVTLPEFTPDASPFLVKPRRGRGSQMVFKANSMQDIPASAINQDYVAQQLLEPSTAEVTAGVFRSKQGELRVVQLRRRLAGGSTSWSEVIENSEALEQISLIAQSLDLHGPINVQYIVTEEGPRIFEINPRLSSTIAIRDEMGFTDLLWWLQEMNSGEIQSWEPPQVGTVGVKLNSPLVCKPEQLSTEQLSKGLDHE
jgi:carbamoyl-phosphate synthase large subunit